MTHIKTTVIVLIIAMILSLVLTYASIMTVVQKTKDDTERVLQSYVTQNSMPIYNSLKNGNDYIPSVNVNYFMIKYKEYGGTFATDGDFLYNENINGGYVYKISNPTVSFSKANSLTLYANTNLYFPIEFAGKKISDLVIPIKVKTSFNLKN